LSKALKRIEGKVTPEALQITLLDEVAGRLEDLSLMMQKLIDRVTELGDSVECMRAEMRKVPIGIQEDFLVEVSDKMVKLDFPEPFFSCNIYNNGPDPVYHALNTTSFGNAAINAHEDLQIDLHAPKIKSLAFKCDRGCSAVVRVFAVR